MKDEADYGLSIGDAMSALLLIIILVMMNALSTLQEESDKANQFEQKRKELYHSLYSEFQSDFERLHLEVDTVHGVIEFSSPDVLFTQGKAQVKQEFKDILSEFYPRYLGVLTEPDFKLYIREIRVEGHTSSEWTSKTISTERAYLKNLVLSQERSFEVLQYLLKLPDRSSSVLWFRDKAAAMGYSSSKLIMKPDGVEEDKGKSRRVSFRALLDYEQFMVGRQTPAQSSL